MTSQQISYQKGVMLAGGAPFGKDSLHAAMALAPHAIAADSGADRLAEVGIVPDIVIGDMDSLRGTFPEATRLYPVAEQESTDFAKCITRVEAPFYIGIGFLGGRVDHTLAALSVLLQYSDKRIILLGENDVAFIAPPDWSMTMEPGARISFYPLLPCRGVSSKGLRWPIESLHMTAGGQIGTSNEASDTTVSARFEPNNMITLVPQSYLEAVVKSLTHHNDRGS